MPNWFRQNKQGEENDSDNNQGEIKPEEFKKQLADEFELKLKAIQEDNDKKMKPLIEMANGFKEQKEAADRQALIERNKQKASETEVDDDLWITNPAEAHRRSTANLEARTQGLAAMAMRREYLSDKEYYTGDLKTKIDELIEAQPLNARSNPSVIENAYYTVLGRHSTEIAEGKHKKQMSAASFSGNGTGGNKGENTDSEDVMTEEERYVANKFGMSEADWKKNKTDAREKGSLSYV